MASRTREGKDLKALESEFKAWRRRRRRGARIPEPLWARAVSLSEAHGLWKVSKRLKLDYYHLKKRYKAPKLRSNARVATSAKRSRVGKRKATVAAVKAVAAFVELPWKTEPEPECLLEFEDTRGSRLRIGLRRLGVQQLEAAVRVLWELGR